MTEKKNEKKNTFKRFRTTYFYGNTDPIEWQGREHSFDSRSITDKEAYMPVSKDTINLTRNAGNGGQGVYDFPDGKDTGLRPYRDIGADIVDIQERIDAKQEKAKKRAQEAIQDEEDIKQRARNITRVEEAIQADNG